MGDEGAEVGMEGAGSGDRRGGKRGSSTAEAIRTTVVPIRILIRTTVVPIWILIGTTVVRIRILIGTTRI